MFAPAQFSGLMVKRPTAPGGGTTFPTLTGLIGRWNALPGNVSESGGTVTSATDLSGSGNNLTHSGGNVPTSSTGYNGHPAFIFTASAGGALSKSSFPMGTGNKATVAVVCQMLNGTSSYGGLVAYAAPGTGDYNGAGSALFFARNATNNAIDSRADAQWLDNINSISLATNYRLVLTYDAADGASAVKVYINNSIGITTAGLADAFVSAGILSIGSRVTAGALDLSACWEGAVTEVVVCNAKLSGTELNNLDSYFTGTWGV